MVVKIRDVSIPKLEDNLYLTFTLTADDQEWREFVVHYRNSLESAKRETQYLFIEAPNANKLEYTKRVALAKACVYAIRCTSNAESKIVREPEKYGLKIEDILPTQTRVRSVFESSLEQEFPGFVYDSERTEKECDQFLIELQDMLKQQ